MDPWLSDARGALAAAAALRPEELALSPEAERTLLELARVAAHESGERTNAPLLCYLAGRAQERGGIGLDELADAVKSSF